MINLFKECPIPEKELLSNLNLFIKRQPLSRVIFLYELYKKILGIHGNILEFGVRWGQDMAIFECFRGMLEPFNYTRKIIGFDTFKGFPNVSDHDADAKVGDMGVTEGYRYYLGKILTEQEKASPITQITKHELVKGNVVDTMPEYLFRHPETIISLAYFDFDIYEPTKVCLDLCKDRFTKGAVIAFDEANNVNWPGETVAIQEALGLRNIKLERFPWCPTMSYMVVN
jgi:hypothetical protein